jgi:hypothetical protein
VAKGMIQNKWWMCQWKWKKLSKYLLCVHYLLIPSIHPWVLWSQTKYFLLGLLPTSCAKKAPFVRNRRTHSSLASNHLNDSKLHVVKSSQGLLPHQIRNHGIAMAFLTMPQFHIW